MFLHRSKSQGLMSGECEAYFTDLHCHHAREVFHVGGIMNRGWPVHYGSVSALQSWWSMLPNEILHIPGMSFRCAVSLCGLLRPHWLSYHPHVAHPLPTPLFQPSQNSFATKHLNICNGRGLTLCPCYTPPWPYIIVCPQATSEFIQEHIAVCKYSFIDLHYDSQTSLVYKCVISACRSITWFIYSLPVQLPGNCEFSLPCNNDTFFLSHIMNGACKLFLRYNIS